MQGNLTVPIGTTITVQVGAVVTVEGCVTIDGILVVDITGRTIVSGAEVDVVNFNNSCSGGPVGFSNITVIGAQSEPCKQIQAKNNVKSRTLSVVFEVVDIPNCGAVSVPTASTSLDSSTMTAIIAGSVVGAIVIIVLIILAIFLLRRKVIPSRRDSEEMRRRQAEHVYLPEDGE